MKVRALIIPAVLALALTGCGGGTSPVASPTPSSSSSDSAAPTAAPSPSAPAVALPAGCESLVRTSAMQAQFGSDVVPIVLPSPGSPVAQSFIDRGGLTCLWGIPQSDAAITVYAAPRATATDEEQVNLWRTAGFSECPPFLDACFFEVINSELGEYRTVYVLVAGFELQVQAGTDGIDPLLIVAREASNNMGYL
ncbi:MAG: hypothetical protein ABIW32_00475 [Terrimesophilobacter sp.]